MVRGSGDFYGSYEQTFRIAYDLSGQWRNTPYAYEYYGGNTESPYPLPSGEQTYTGSQIKPIPTLICECYDENGEPRTKTLVYCEDFVCSWGKNVDIDYSPEGAVGSGIIVNSEWLKQSAPQNPHIIIEGRGDWAGYLIYRFMITKAWLRDAVITVPDQEYTGGSLEPVPAAVFNGMTLKEGEDFAIIGYSNNVKKSGAAASAVALNKKEAKMLAGKTLTLKATVTPSNAINKAITWSSSDKSAATVNSSGKVVGKKAGTVVITAKTKDGGKTARTIMH